eukprot:scaffold8.g1393.t1
MSAGNIFVTGGVGFIGSHTVLALVERGYKVHIIDNLDNSFEECFNRMKELAGDKAGQMTFTEGDLRYKDQLENIFKKEKVERKWSTGGENCKLNRGTRSEQGGVRSEQRVPLHYYDHNVLGLINLADYVPIDEAHSLAAINPYGRTKLIIEDIFRDVAAADPECKGQGHVAAVDKLEATPGIGCTPYNLGTGTGTTVLEMVHAFEAASGLKVNLNLTGRRPGDAEAVWAATETAERELGWWAKLTVKEMCADQWRWASQNPDGFETKPSA